MKTIEINAKELDELWAIKALIEHAESEGWFGEGFNDLNGRCIAFIRALLEKF